MPLREDLIKFSVVSMIPLESSRFFLILPVTFQIHFSCHLANNEFGYNIKYTFTLKIWIKIPFVNFVSRLSVIHLLLIVSYLLVVILYEDKPDL